MSQGSIPRLSGEELVSAPRRGVVITFPAIRQRSMLPQVLDHTGGRMGRVIVAQREAVISPLVRA